MSNKSDDSNNTTVGVLIGLAAIALVAILVVSLTSCSKVGSSSPGEACTGNNGYSGIVGNDDNCYTCNNGGYAYYGYTAGYCGTETSGVSCCGTTYYSGYGGLVCNKSGYPYLCSDGQCWNQANGNGYLTCVYDP